MNLIDAFLFACRSEFGNLAPIPFIYGGIALLVSFFLIGLIWGKLWNQRWHLSPGLIALNLLWAFLLMTVAFALSSVSRTTAWIENLRISLVPQVSASGTLNREILRDAWNLLQPLGGQNELTSPTAGGNELRLNNSTETEGLARVAATDVKRHLLTQEPFALGATVYVQDPAAVAEEVKNNVPAPAYPVIVGPSNAWSKAASAFRALSLRAQRRQRAPDPSQQGWSHDRRGEQRVLLSRFRHARWRHRQWRAGGFGDDPA